MSTEFSFSQLTYLLYPLLGGVGVALAAGPLGAFMVWRRMAYFGDTLSHSGLLGITFALALNMNIMLGVLIIALCIAFSLLCLEQRLKVTSDTVLGILSHTSLALGLLLLATLKGVRFDVIGFLMGDILTVTATEVGMIYLGVVVVLAMLLWLWQPLLRVTLSRELAQAEGLAVSQLERIYVILLAVVVASAIKIVGVLLITALLLIPAAAARPLAKEPESMAVLASILGIVSVVMGMLLSHLYDLPTGPAIVVVAAASLVVTTLLSKIR